MASYGEVWQARQIEVRQGAVWYGTSNKVTLCSDDIPKNKIKKER
jgi:hypothetical protein